MSSADYHLHELDIARSKSDPRRSVPDVPRETRRILDIGCGMGQTLMAIEAQGAMKVGIDCDFQALQLGKQYRSDIALVYAAGEALPFRDNTYDFVMSRVALPYMHIPTVVREAARVLVPDGRVWFVLHPASMLSWRAAGSVKRLVYQIYVATNSMLFHSIGIQVRFPLNRTKIESVQTSRGMTRCLAAAGFVDIQFQRGRHFLLTARKGEP
jgi:ubiquinone/menaquinone biosynthesis C-methylase UbiE